VFYENLFEYVRLTQTSFKVKEAISLGVTSSKNYPYFLNVFHEINTLSFL
jgi:hypothetical protein